MTPCFRTKMASSQWNLDDFHISSKMCILFKGKDFSPIKISERMCQEFGRQVPKICSKVPGASLRMPKWLFCGAHSFECLSLEYLFIKIKNIYASLSYSHPLQIFGRYEKTCKLHSIITATRGSITLLMSCECQYFNMHIHPFTMEKDRSSCLRHPENGRATARFIHHE